MAIPSGVEPGVDLLPKLIPKVEKRQVSVIEGVQSREIGGGFIAALPQSNSIPAKGGDGSNNRRRFLRKDEVIVPKSLQEPSSKRAPYYCEDSSYAHAWWNHAVEIAAATENAATGANIAAAPGGAAQTRPGYTCYRDSLGQPQCRAPGSDDSYITTTRRTTIRSSTTRSSTSTTPTETPESSEPEEVEIPDDDETPDNVANQDETIDTTEFTFPTTMPTPSNSTSSSSKTSSTPSSSSAPNIPISANGAMAVTLQEGYIFILAPVLFALGHALVLK
ncbi:hypothetical protein FS837_008639 [Tulasnella sp. UAMH 9824]|nr:hypothetical protein FS837_008639 [Tulasnella sp. UAMH 9824]